MFMTYLQVFKFKAFEDMLFMMAFISLCIHDQLTTNSKCSRRNSEKKCFLGNAWIVIFVLKILIDTVDTILCYPFLNG